MAGEDHQPGPGGKRKPKAHDVLVELVERQVEKVLAPFVDALEATGEEGGANYAIRMQAAKELMDRAWGKPKQAVDVDHTSGGQSLSELFAATPLGQAHSELPVDEEDVDG